MDAPDVDGMARLADGAYRGRGLALGPAPDGRSAVIVYWITGRSARSRNRRLVESADGTVRTAFADAARGDDPALLLYPLLAGRGGTCVVGNGQQTRPVLDALCAGRTLERALRSWSAEPDQLATPRIVGAVEAAAPAACRLGLVRQRTEDGRAVTERVVWACDGLPPGSGRCLTTYAGGAGDPAPFAGDPLRVRFDADPRATCDRFREALAGPLLVGVMVRFASVGGSDTAIANLQG